MPIVWLARKIAWLSDPSTRSLGTQAYHHIQKPRHPSNMPKSKSIFYFQFLILQINQSTSAGHIGVIISFE